MTGDQIAPLGAQGRGASLAQPSKPGGAPAVPRPLTPREKAAVIVRFLLSEGAVLDLSRFRSGQVLMLSCLSFEGHGAFPAQCGMPTTRVVEAVDVFE